MRSRAIAPLFFLVGCATDPDPGPPPPPPIDVSALTCRGLPDACGDHGLVQVARFDSDRDLERRLVGAWRFCGASTDAFRKGFELKRDGRLFFLTAAADGSCRRTDEWTGAWEVFDISEQNPEGTYQLVLEDAAGSTSLVPTFTTQPVVLVDSFGGFEFARLAP